MLKLVVRNRRIAKHRLVTNTTTIVLSRAFIKSKIFLFTIALEETASPSRRAAVLSRSAPLGQSHVAGQLGRKCLTGNASCLRIILVLVLDLGLCGGQDEDENEDDFKSIGLRRNFSLLCRAAA